MLVNSGILGLDDILDGGFSRGNCVLLHGGPGSGKTTFAIQFLCNGIIKYNEPGIFVTLCENPDEIRKNMLAFGWDLKKLESQKKLVILDARPVTLTKEGYIIQNDALFKGETVPFSHIARLILESMNEIKAKRLVIDSITVLTSQYQDVSYIRQGLLGLIQMLSNLDCSSLLLTESRGDLDEALLERALVQGVIVIYYVRKGSSMARAIQVLKLRGHKHSLDIYLMEISDKGIIVHPEERIEI
jgi:circadian clock protein KaiC